MDYLIKLAKIVNASFDDSKNEWYWSVKRNGKYLNIIEYLNFKDGWKKQISDTLETINKIEDNQ